MLQNKTEPQNSSYDSPISKKLIIAVLVLFTPLTVMAVVQNGFLGIFAKAFQNYATIQIFVDLLIASFLILYGCGLMPRKQIAPFGRGHCLLWQQDHSVLFYTYYSAKVNDRKLLCNRGGFLERCHPIHRE